FSTFFVLSLVTSLAHARDFRYSDAHVHYVYLFQESEGMPRLREAMVNCRVDHVMLSVVAVAKKWHEDESKRARYYAGDDAGA
ncbi:amidohydrolase, partial [Pseudomonas aeruginosa]